MKAFKVSGRVLMGHDFHHFDIEVADASPEAAKERVVSTLGSRHRAPRRNVQVEGVVEITPDEVTDPVVERRLGNA